METITLAAILAAIIAIGGAASVIAKATKPWRDMTEKVAEHERKLDADFKAQQELLAIQNAQSIAIAQIANHLIDGNHVDKLAAARDELMRVTMQH